MELYGKEVVIQFFNENGDLFKTEVFKGQRITPEGVFMQAIVPPEGTVTILFMVKDFPPLAVSESHNTE